MRFTAGCLTGIIVGIILAIGGYAAYTFLFSTDNLSLFPASPAGNPDLTITISEAYLNDQLQAGLAAQGLSLSDLAIKLHAPNRAAAGMTMNIRVLGQPFSIHPQASFHFGVTSGAIFIALDQVNVAGFNVPQNVVDQQLGGFQRYAESELNAEAKRALASTGLHVIGVQATENALIIQLAR
jgi:hypothetical protein